MSWKNVRKRFQTLRIRLALWLVGMLTCISSVVFVLVYFALDSRLVGNRDAELVSEIEEWSHLNSASGLPALKVEFDSEVASFGGQRVFCRIYGPDHTLRLSSDMSAWKGLPPPPRNFVASGAVGPGGALLESLRLPGRKYGIRTVYMKDEAGNLYQLGMSEEDIEAVLEPFPTIAVLGVIALIFAGGGCVYVLSTRSLAGLRRITDSVMHVTRGDFSRRVQVGSGATEIDELARTFNLMQDRIQALIEELRDVSMNIAHDLRSPLTRIRGVAEAALTGKEAPDDYLEVLGVVVEESDRMVGVINTMLEIAEAESGLINYSAGVTDLSAVIHDAVELFRAVAENKGLSLEASCPERRICIRGDESRLQRVVANLIENAIKYTPPGGRVSVRDFSQNGRIVIEVLDTGIGISEDEIPRVFNRFYRGDASRSSPGHGLGLSFVASIVRAHGGDVTVKSVVGRQTLFTVSFPTSLQVQDGMS